MASLGVKPIDPNWACAFTPQRIDSTSHADERVKYRQNNTVMTWGARGALDMWDA